MFLNNNNLKSFNLLIQTPYWNFNNKFWNFFSFFSVNNFLNYNFIFPLNFYLSIKKNPIKKLQLLNKYRNFSLFYKFIFFYKFKFNRFNHFIISKNFNKIPTKKLQPKKLLLSFKKNIYKILSKNRFFLIGSSLSPFRWDLHPKKKWIRKELSMFLIKNTLPFFKINKINQTNFKLKNLKKYFYSNFKYFFKFKLNYNELSFLIKKKPVKKFFSSQDWFYSRPYLFLNNFNSFKLSKNFPNAFTATLFRNYFKLFNYFKKFNYSTRLRRTNDFLFKKFITKKSYIFKNKHNRSLILYKNLNNCFSFFLFKNENIFIKNIKKKNSIKKSFFLLYKSIYFIKTKLTRKYKFSNYFKSIKLIKKNNRINWKLKKLNLIRKIKNSKHIFSINKFKWLKLKKITTMRSIFKQNDLFYGKSILLKSSFKNNFSKNKFNFAIKRKIIKKISLKKSKIFKKLYFATKDKLNFLHNKYGFLFINNLSYNFIKNYSNFYSTKKSMFSFPYKNELQKFILKRYVKLHSSLSFTNYKNHILRNSLLKEKFNPSNVFNFNINDPLFNSFSLKTSLMTIYESNYFNSTNWSNFNYQILYAKTLENDPSDLNLKRIRFKPGYMTIWRESRKSLQSSLNLNFKYQYKLTNYLSKYNKFIKFKTFLINEMSLNNLLIKSRIFTETFLINLLIKNNLIYVNGILNNNPHSQLYVGDFIQILINLKYYIMFKWFLNLSLKKKNRLKKLSRKKMSSSFSTEDKKRSNSLPKWILFSQNTIDDVSKFLEVDYFTLSVFIIYEPFLWSDINVYNIINNKFSIINVYNWKYIN